MIIRDAVEISPYDATYNPAMPLRRECPLPTLASGAGGEHDRDNEKPDPGAFPHRSPEEKKHSMKRECAIWEAHSGLVIMSRYRNKL